jgi:hypothetical protein
VDPYGTKVDWVPEFPVATIVLATGYEEVTAEIPTGLVVDQEMVVTQLLLPEVMVQEGVVRVPDMDDLVKGNEIELLILPLLTDNIRL